MSAITLGEVTVDSVVDIDRSSFPTPSMLPDSTAGGVARHLSWLKPHFFDERTGDIGSRAHFPRPERSFARTEAIASSRMR